MHSLWITFGPVLLINALLIVSFVVFLLKRRTLPLPVEMQGRHQSRILGALFHHYWYWLTEPVARFCVTMRLSPNIITFMGFCVSSASALLFAQGWFGYAGWVMIFGSSFDLIDGKVARLTGRASRSGAFFDSVLDRVSEGIVLLGLAMYYRSGWMLPVVIIALIGSMMVSYARARGEGVGVVCKTGPMQRPERVAYLAIASVLQPVADSLLLRWYAAPPAVLVIVALALIALLTTCTVIYRTVFIMNALDTADRTQGAPETIPQMLTKLGTKEGREEILDRMRH